MGIVYWIGIQIKCSVQIRSFKKYCFKKYLFLNKKVSFFAFFAYAYTDTTCFV